MDFKHYQECAGKTAIYPTMGELALNGIDAEEGLLGGRDVIRDCNPKNPYYPALGLAGEVGEYCNKLKKVMRDNGGVVSPEFIEDAKGELGDVLWYLAANASELGLSLEEIAEANLAKLKSRQERNQLGGAGDNR